MYIEDKNLTLLKAEWQKYFKTKPYKQASQVFLSKNITWQKQAKEQGINLKKFYKLMDSALAKTELGKKPKLELILKSGTKLIRQWKGQKHEVIASENAFVYNGKNYKSLSAIACEITGSQWNGKIFFGVKK